MPQAQVNGVTLHYEQQGSGEPLVLIPFLSADHGCYAFQLPAYAEHFACWSVDLRGTGASGEGDRPYSTALFARDIAAFMDTVGIDKAHIFGVSLGAGVGMRFAAAFPERTLSLSLHGPWSHTDPYVRTVIASWQVMAEALGDVAETTIRAILPWCFTPDTYAARPDFIEEVAGFIRSRPKQSVSAFLEHTRAVLDHDARAELPGIKAPTQISFGSRDEITSTRFAAPLLAGIPHAELEIFEGFSHAPCFEDVEAFNARTLSFLLRQVGEAPILAAEAPAALPAG
jgi:pimeloyl-ACP methyl ester carboxylesterase